MNKLITIVIPFLNEGDEPRKTIRSISETADSNLFEIILIDDASDEEYDFFLPYPNIKYIRNQSRLGTQQCKDLGVTLAKTPYILMIDAHMRFYTKNWLEKALNILTDEPTSIFCTVSQNFSYNKLKDFLYPKRLFGANINLHTDQNSFNEILEAKGIAKKQSTNRVSEVPCLIGANYFFHKSFYQKIKGLEGLKSWGSTEPYLSLKVFFAGGRCKVINDIVIGHLYRANGPYTVLDYHKIYNKLFLIHTLFPQKEMKIFVQNYRNSSPNFKAAFLLLKKNKKEVERYQKYYKSIFTKNYYDFVKEYDGCYR